MQGMELREFGSPEEWNRVCSLRKMINTNNPFQQAVEKLRSIPRKLAVRSEMSSVPRMINEERAVQHLLDLLAIEGLSGREKPVADCVTAKLIEAGCSPDWIRDDGANDRIPGDYEIGNLVVQLPGTVDGPRLMFSGHLDTVPVTAGAMPRIEGRRIVSQEDCGLGADNRTAVAALVVLAETLLRDKPPHPPVTLLFTVGEEVGLWGARYVDPAQLGHPAMGFNIDSGDPNVLTIGAIGAARWEAEIYGISSHAGVHPEQGVSAIVTASKAITELEADGWLGRVEQPEGLGTANIGIVSAGQATNEITGHLYLKGESRSHDTDFLSRLTDTIRETFEKAVRETTNHEGKTGRLDWREERDYDSFRIPEEAAVVQHTVAAGQAQGLQPVCAITDGGLDANYLNQHGIPTVTLGAGQHGAHTVDEYADIDEFIGGCQLILGIATTPLAERV